MPARADPNEDAAALLEKRRAQNRLAQQRFREKKLALKRTGRTSPTTSVLAQSSVASSSTTKATTAPLRSSSSSSSFSTQASSPSSSSASMAESDKGSSPPTTLSPASTDEGSSYLTARKGSYTAAASPPFPSVSMPTVQQAGPSLVPDFTYPDVFASSSSGGGSVNSSDNASTRTSVSVDQTPSSAVNLADTLADVELIGSTSALPLGDNDYNYMLSIMRESQQTEWEQRQAQAVYMLQQHQAQQQAQIAQQQQPSTPSRIQDRSSPRTYESFEDLLRDFEFPQAVTPSNTGSGSSDLLGLGDWATTSAGLHSSLSPSSTQKQPSSSAAAAVDHKCPYSWEVSRNVTGETGLMAVVLMQSGMPTVAALRQSMSPTIDQGLHPSFPLAKAFFHNAVALGFLDDDLRQCGHVSNIHTIWPKRSLPYLNAWAKSGHKDISSLKQLERVDVGGSSSSNLFDGTMGIVHSAHTVSGPNPFGVPTSLGEREEVIRLQKLRCAENLYPTKLQLEREHTIIIDTLPWPSVRDALIRLVDSGIVDNTSLKGDLLGKQFNLAGDGYVFTIHGDDPSDPEAWELSEFWALKYAPILEPSIIKRTNFWRRMSGKPDLDFAKPDQDRTITQGLARLAASGMQLTGSTSSSPSMASVAATSMHQGLPVGIRA